MLVMLVVVALDFRTVIKKAQSATHASPRATALANNVEYE